MSMKRFIYLILLCAAVSSCGSGSKMTRGTEYSLMYDEKPATLLIMPPINNTNSVEAKEYVYTTLAHPLAEAGYYVIAPLYSKDVLKSENAYDSEIFVDASLTGFRKYFGADAVVFSEIEKWEDYGGNSQVIIRYFIRSTVTGEILFDRRCNMNYYNRANSYAPAVTYDPIFAVRCINYYIFSDLPRGKYDQKYLKDQGVAVDRKDIMRSGDWQMANSKSAPVIVLAPTLF